MTHPEAYRARSEAAVPQQAGPALPAPAPAQQPDAAAEAPVWSERATTTRGMIGRPASLAAVEAAAASRASGLAMTAVSEMTARPADLTPDPPRSGTVYGRPQADRTGKVLSGRMARLHIGWHEASSGTLAQLRPPAGPAGLLLGVDAAQQPVALRLFRPAPTRIALVGGEWAAYVMVLRAAALGATISVWTDDLTRWRQFAERTAAAGTRIVVNTEYQLNTATTAQQPQLLVTDDGSGAVGDSGEERPWRASLTVVRRLDQRAAMALQEADLVLAQRLDAAESFAAASALHLPASAMAPLQQLDDETIALVTATTQQYTRMTPTDLERSYAGQPRR